MCDNFLFMQMKCIGKGISMLSMIYLPALSTPKRQKLSWVTLLFAFPYPGLLFRLLRTHSLGRPQLLVFLWLMAPTCRWLLPYGFLLPGLHFTLAETYCTSNTTDITRSQLFTTGITYFATFYGLATWMGTATFIPTGTAIGSNRGLSILSSPGRQRSLLIPQGGLPNFHNLGFCYYQRLFSIRRGISGLGLYSLLAIGPGI